MKTTLMKLLVVSLFAAGFASCNKEGANPSPSAIFLTQQAWKFEIYGLDENNNGVIEASENAMQSCESDDAFTFYLNGTGIYQSGAVKCTVDDPTSLNLSWHFTNNETELQIFTAPEKISKLDETTLEIYYLELNSQGQQVKYIRRFHH